MKKIEVEGYKIVYDEYGNANNPAIIMLHGWFSYRGVWKKIAGLLKGNYYCVAVDLLGFGDSDKPEKADYSIEAQSKRIVEIAQGLGLDRFSIIGHSMGGQIAMCVASQIAPEKVERLVTVDGIVCGKLKAYIENGIIGFTNVARHFRKLYSIWGRLLDYDIFVRGIFKTWFYKIDAVPRQLWAKDREMAFREEVYISANEAGKAIQKVNLETALPKIIASTLTIFGERDAVVPISDGYLVEKMVQGSQLEIIEDCGHFPMYEKAEEFEQIVLEFFST
jgi:pimeloyl-ACP methyl ester carboxylesterase